MSSTTIRIESHPRPSPVFPALELETRSIISTEAAAFHIGRAPQTLRIWACRGAGLLQPVRIGTRLGWRTDDIRRLLGVLK
jgi:hypothetical protein